jgi:hypothetical protein
MSAPAKRRKAAEVLENLRLADQIAIMRPTDFASRKAGHTPKLPACCGRGFADLP